jgi:nitrate reductase molybdenum cofactor assembly chaperone NarJ/NarW
MMTRTFKALSALLSYPTAELQSATGEISEILETDAAIPARIREQLHRLIAEHANEDLYGLQERYVLLFDRTRSLSLHLFEHVHGESRDRGQAMIDLKAMYEQNGLAMGAGELPDFVPLFLEFLSTRPADEAHGLLGQPAHIFAALAERLRKRESAYEAVFRALVSLAAAKPTNESIAALLQGPDPDATDLAAIDAAWEDEPVSFGPSANNCKDGLIAKIRAGRRPAPGVPPAATQRTRPIPPHP